MLQLNIINFYIENNYHLASKILRIGFFTDSSAAHVLGLTSF